MTNAIIREITELRVRIEMLEEFKHAQADAIYSLMSANNHMRKRVEDLEAELYRRQLERS